MSLKWVKVAFIWLANIKWFLNKRSISINSTAEVLL